MSKSANFRMFLKVNNLTNKAVADYWEVSEQFVGQVAKGKVKLSDKRIAELKENTLGWDTTMLDMEIDNGMYVMAMDAVKGKTNEEAYEIVKANLENAYKTISELQSKLDKIGSVNESMKELRDRVEFLKAQIELKDEMIKYLMNGK